MKVSEERAAELGAAVGYESGHKYGGLTGFVSSGLASLACYIGGGVLNLKTIPGMLIMTSVGYITGSFVGSKIASNSCETIGVKLASQNKTEEEIVEICEHEATIKGSLAGALTGVLIGAGGFSIGKNYFAPIDVLGDGSVEKFSEDADL